MTFLPTGFVDGSRVNGEMLRRAMWIATRGTYGVATGDSFKVVALGTPGAAVLINPGGGAVTTAFPGAPVIQTYTLGNDAAVNLPIPANNSGAAVTWHVIVRVRDPQYAGETVPGSPQTDTYNTVEAVSALPSGKPYLHLATIVVPANTSAITQAMITDKRILIAARSQQEAARVLTFSSNNDMPVSVYANWPTESNKYRQSYTSPPWASQAFVKVTAAGVYATGTAPIYGGMRLMFNGSASQHAILYSEGSPNRLTVVGMWALDIPANLRGTTVNFDLQGDNSSGAGKTLRADFQTQLGWEVVWQENLT
jgi:hypothetical protein